MRTDGAVKLFVAGFDDSTTLVDLVMLLNEHGDVTGIKMKQGEKRRYAVVEMGAYYAERAITELDGKSWRGTRLEVKESWW